MAVPTKSFTTIVDTRIDADSPFIEELGFDYRDNDEHLQEVLYGSFTAEAEHNHDGINSAPVNPNELASANTQELTIKRWDDTDAQVTDPVIWEESIAVGTDIEFNSDDNIARMGLINGGSDDVILTSRTVYPMLRMAWRCVIEAAVETWTANDFLIGWIGDVDPGNQYALFRRGTTSGTFKVVTKRQIGDTELVLDNQAMSFGKTYGDVHKFEVEVKGFGSGGDPREVIFTLDDVLVKRWSFDDSSDLHFGIVTNSAGRVNVRVLFPGGGSGSGYLYLDTVRVQRVGQDIPSPTVAMDAVGTWFN